MLVGGGLDTKGQLVGHLTVQTANIPGEFFKKFKCPGVAWAQGLAGMGNFEIFWYIRQESIIGAMRWDKRSLSVVMTGENGIHFFHQKVTLVKVVLLGIRLICPTCNCCSLSLKKWNKYEKTVIEQQCELQPFPLKLYQKIKTISTVDITFSEVNFRSLLKMVSICRSLQLLRSFRQMKLIPTTMSILCQDGAAKDHYQRL